MIRLRRVSLERRHGNMEEAEHLLEDAVRNAKSISESSFYAIKLARHLFKVQKNLPKARKVLSEAIEIDKVCVPSLLYLKKKTKPNKKTWYFSLFLNLFFFFSFFKIWQQ